MGAWAVAATVGKPGTQTVMKIFFQTLCVLFVGGWLVQTASAQDPAKQSPDKYKVIFNNDKMRVLDVRLKAGDKSPMHSHPNYVVYSFNNSTVKFTSKDGKSTDVKIKAGECTWRNAETHAVENTGKTDVHVLNIELKR
jgi:beta-alanine degradation protein BauB